MSWWPRRLRHECNDRRNPDALGEIQGAGAGVILFAVRLHGLVEHDFMALVVNFFRQPAGIGKVGEHREGNRDSQV